MKKDKFKKVVNEIFDIYDGNLYCWGDDEYIYLTFPGVCTVNISKENRELLKNELIELCKYL